MATTGKMEHSSRVLRVGGGVFAIVSMPALAIAQAAPTATTHGDLQVGGGYVRGDPDYGTHNGNGFVVFADADVWKHFGIAGEFHHLSSPGAISESTYDFGARYRYPVWRVEPYLELLGGAGKFSFGNSSQNGTYGMYAGGGGVDLHTIPKFIFRVDYEYQRWGSFVPRGLQPNLATVGVAYRFR